MKTEVFIMKTEVFIIEYKIVFQYFISFDCFSDILMFHLLFTCLKWGFIFIVLLLLSGVVFEYYTRWKLEKTAFLGKNFVEVNGKPLHYVKKGEGDYTIVFQSGMGSSYTIWQEIQDSLSKNAVTISYDRNGIMLSESNGLSVTNAQVSEELELLLEKTKCPKPYILVGHSMAGIYLRPFIKNNKKNIKGIVFIEATHPQIKERASIHLLNALKQPPNWLVKLVVNTGIYRTFFSFFPMSSEIPINHYLHQKEKDFFYKTSDKVLEELNNDTLNFKSVENNSSFGNIPLTIIMGTSEIRYSGIKNEKIKNEYRQLLNDLQYDLLKLSTNSNLVKAENSGHIVQVNDALLIIYEIEKMIN